MFIGFLSANTMVSFDQSIGPDSEGPIKCVSLKNQACKPRQTLFGINFDETLFLPIYCVKKCDGSWNTIYDPKCRDSVQNKVKNMNVKVFSLLLESNETRFLVQNASYECKCGSN